MLCLLPLLTPSQSLGDSRAARGEQKKGKGRLQSCLSSSTREGKEEEEGKCKSAANSYLRWCLQGTPQDIYQASLQVPPLMPRAVYQPVGAPAPVAFQSQVRIMMLAGQVVLTTLSCTMPVTGGVGGGCGQPCFPTTDALRSRGND